MIETGSHEIAISSHPSRLMDALTIQKRLTDNHRESIVLEPYHEDDPDATLEDKIDTRYALLKKVGANVLFVINEDKGEAPADLDEDSRVDIAVASLLNQEDKSTYQNIHTIDPPDHYARDAAELKRMGIRSIRSKYVQVTN